VSVAQPAATKKTSNAGAATAAGARRFDNPQQAADVLIDAAAKFDVVELAYIFGPDGDDIVFSGEFAQDRSTPRILLLRPTRKRTCPWIQRAGIARSSSSAMTIALPRAACEEG